MISPVSSGCFKPSLPFPSPSLRSDGPLILSLFAELDTKIQKAINVPHPEWNTTVTLLSIQVTSAEDTIGFAFLVAGDGKASKWIENLVLTITIRGIENIAHEQTRQKYAGSYHAPSNTGINPSLTLSLDGSSGLVVTSWISNGTDFLPNYTSFWSDEPGKAQLIPSRIERGAAGEVWRLTFVQPDVKPKSVVDTCQMNDVDSIMYGGRSVDEFVFLRDCQGRIQGVELSAFRITLAKAPDGEGMDEAEVNSRLRNTKPLIVDARDLYGPKDLQDSEKEKGLEIPKTDEILHHYQRI